MQVDPMPIHVCPNSERPPAYVAWIRLLAGVGTSVRLQVDGRAKALAANGAYMWAYPGVDVPVEGERIFAGKGFAAELALEQLRLGVYGRSVTLQIAQLSERLVAIRTLKRTFT